MKRILISDDELSTRDLLKHILEDGGYDDIVEASNPQEAVDAYTTSQPDLVILDFSAPAVGSLSAAKQIKSRFPAANIIICTANSQRNTVLEAMRSGANDCLVKPFQPQQVVDSVRKLIG